MECQDVYRLMNRYIDGEITLEEEKVLEFHLGRCKVCQTEFSQLKDMNLMLNTLEPVHDFTDQVLAKIRAEKQMPKLKRWVPQTFGSWVKVAAVILLCVFLASHLYPKPAHEVIISKGQVKTEVSQEGTQKMTVLDGEIRVKGLEGKLTAINSQIVFEGEKADLHGNMWEGLWEKVKEFFSRLAEIF